MKRKLPLMAILLLCTLGAGAQHKEVRGISSLQPSEVPFVQKGAWSVGGSYSLSVASERSKVSTYSLDLSPEFSYAVSNDLEIGVRGLYNRSLADMPHLGVDIEGITIAVDDYWKLSHRYGGAAFARKYLPIGTSGKVAIFVDAQFGIKAGQGINTRNEDGHTKGTYEHNTSFTLDIQPGVALQLTQELSLMAGLGIAGVSYSTSSQVHNQVYSGKSSSLAAYYAMNPLSLSIGSRWSFRNKKQFRRDVIVEKGETMANFSLANASAESFNSELLTLVDGIDGKANLITFSPQISYAYKANAAMGFNVDYTSGSMHVDHLAASLPGSDMGIELKDVDAKITSYGASLFHRNYFAFDSKGTFGGFCEIAVAASNLGLEYGQEKLLRNFSAKAVFSPGIILYVLPFVSLEASAGIADLAVTVGKDMTSVAGGMRFNLLNCKFGVSYHL